MTLISFGMIPQSTLAELEDSARRAFPHDDSQRHIDIITARSNEESKRESLFALVILARLCDKCGLDRRNLAISREESGRPFFVAAAVDFSISHSGGAVAVALSDSGCVGVDIETTDLPPERAKKMSARYFSSDDQTDIKCDPSQFARIWTEKEAYAKLCKIPLAFLLSSKNQTNHHLNTSVANNVFFHRFSLGIYPVTLCSDNDGDVTVLPLS